ncbi:rhs repeat-associated core domain-containing protein : YD repeat protein OS=Isosphaera pallida (strain ATCC 43644 / DSM 9630 / IS1B) GN=Isop_2419 PE=4 SV=1 [Gemmata massiliana]|uniref:Rhs repeat-associated core domain-containing protein: YD repeat protein n=1 Tax=Gemmata massiliana TaxID=1210884 RepID=A0A6P2D683_9BACT|nr:hypothetical protein [Gemmata massiliana]VTR96659.1 rhs repeat-associated core domain-containing protein : YD repeat protein OS=Isosphaera pallida (strain ATCC 43644 / DSM 9630 / IS1B) GN=Isop_2419 PE=4 SV=1 [Gemmata massiliana]
MAGGLLTSNAWKTKTVETLPDGTTNTIYTNGLGQVMLKVYTDAASNVWRWYTQYDADGRAILEAGPSVVTGYSESYVDLVNFVSGNAQHLNDSTGLVTAYTYGFSNSATDFAAADVVGYLKRVDLKQGETGAAVPQRTLTYIKHTELTHAFFFTASDTVYRNDNGTGALTTSYAYTYYDGFNQVASVVATLPTVTTAQNGSNAATMVTTVSEAFGHPVWTKDQAGIITYTEYDTLTGAVVKTITDVDTTQTGTFAVKPGGSRPQAPGCT